MSENAKTHRRAGVKCPACKVKLRRRKASRCLSPHYSCGKCGGIFAAGHGAVAVCREPALHVDDLAKA